MTSQSTRLFQALVVMSLLVAQPALAQVQPRGWPDRGGDSASPAKPVAVARPAAGTNAKPVAARPEVATTKPAVVVTARPAPAAPAAAATEVVAALKLQAELLQRLADEIALQRAAMREQQDKIEALERHVIVAAAAPVRLSPPEVTPTPRPFTAGAASLAIKTGRLMQGWYAPAPGTSSVLIDRFSAVTNLHIRTVTGRPVSPPSSATRTGVWPASDYYRNTFAGGLAARYLFIANVQTSW